MKILMIIDSLVKGGRERRLIELLKALKAYENVEVGLVLFSKKVEYEEIFDLPVKIYYLERKPAKDPRVFYRFYQICKSEKPDIVHSWGWMPSVYAVPTVKLLNIRFINAAITDAPDDMNWVDDRYFRAKLTFPFSDIIVGNSKAGLQVYNAPAIKSQCIYNGFDFKRIRQLKSELEIKNQFNIPTDKKVVGMVGAFFDRKDYTTYINAANSVLEERKDTVFLAIGGGPQLEEFKAKVDPKHRKEVIFTGMTDQVESLVNIFNVGVLATYTEGISNSIMEYMVLGKPVVSSGTGGVIEIVRNGENGFVTPTSDAEKMAEKINFLLNHPDVGYKMGQFGKDLIQNTFSLERMEKDYLELYHSLLNPRIKSRA